jgi:hypothetical protein
VALGQDFLRVLPFSPVNIIPPMLHIHTCIIRGMDNGPLAIAIPKRIIVLPHRNKKKV